jgi:hypothetical protein
MIREGILLLKFYMQFFKVTFPDRAVIILVGIFGKLTFLVTLCSWLTVAAVCLGQSDQLGMWGSPHCISWIHPRTVCGILRFPSLLGGLQPSYIQEFFMSYQ